MLGYDASFDCLLFSTHFFKNSILPCFTGKKVLPVVISRLTIGLVKPQSHEVIATKLHLFADEVGRVVPLEVDHGLRGPPVGQRGEGGRLQLRDVRVHVDQPGGGLRLDDGGGLRL